MEEVKKDGEEMEQQKKEGNVKDEKGNIGWISSHLARGA